MSTRLGLNDVPVTEDLKATAVAAFVAVVGWAVLRWMGERSRP